MMVDSQVRQMIFDNQSTTEIRKYAITDGGMSTLFRDGVDKVLSGITTFEEVYRVAKRTEQDD